MNTYNNKLINKFFIITTYTQYRVKGYKQTYASWILTKLWYVKEVFYTETIFQK